MSEFTKQEYVLLMEALERAAARHTSQSRINKHYDTNIYHKEKAAAMRELRSKILDRRGARS